MKKLVVLVLLVPILALTMISCDADMRSNLAGFMGGFNSNVYADAGFIVPNTAQAEAASATIAAIGTGSGADTVLAGNDTSAMGFEVTLVDDTTFLAPQSKAKQDELKNNLADAFNSKTQKEQLLNDLKDDASSEQKTAAEGTITVFNQTLAALGNKLNTGSTESKELGDVLAKLTLPPIGANPTKGDMLALQLMTDLISNTVAALESIGGGSLDGVDGDALAHEDNKATLLSIIDDALFAAEVAEQISGAASIDFTGQINLGDLMDGLGDKGTRSRGEPVDLSEAEEFLGTINALAPSIVELMGITRIGNDYTYEKSAYDSFLLNQQIYRSSMEQALKMMSLGKLKKADIDSLTFDTSTLVKYALAVFITEHHAFAKSTEADSVDPYTIIAEYLDENPKLGLGTLTKDDQLNSILTGIDYEAWPDFIKGSSVRKGSDEGLTYFKNILKNIVKINDFGGIAQLSTELNKFLNDATDEGFQKTYEEMMK